MRVKICGITNLQDALYAIECGADALGFVFYEKSPRHISIESARAIADKLPPFVELVGLFVNKTAEEIDTMSTQAGMTLAQIHFDTDEQFLNDITIRNLPVVRAKSPEDIGRYADRYRLVDAYCQEYGGSGKRLKLEWFDGVECSKIILAGGLTPKNLSEIKEYGFYGVDVSSATEMTKGIKDPNKVKEFIENAKSI